VAEKGSMLGRRKNNSKTNTKSINPYQRNHRGLQEKQDAEVQSSACPEEAREAVDK